MSAWTLIFLVLFLGTLVVLLVARNQMQARVAASERARVSMEREEGRVFEFLHGLGEAFSEGVRSADLHRLIVESAARILDAEGGALYLASKDENSMVPAFLTKSCPPLIFVPDHVLDQATRLPLALDSYVKLQAVHRKEGVIGEVWRSGENRLIGGDFPENTNRVRQFQVGSAIVGPLVYRRKTLGVLAVANGPTTMPFTEKDVSLFHNLCEQSAFALYNEFVYIEANEKKRLDHDLAIAREIQSVLLPSDPPSVPGYELSGINIPARQVSGDYFDYLVVDDNRTGVAIADVSGKGVPASLIMAMCRSVIRSQAPNRVSAAEVLHLVNRQLYPDIKEDMFISMIYLVLDAHSNGICMARAGHDPPFVYRADTNQIETINPKGMALGIDSGEVFDRVCANFLFQLNKGDCILLYTDGATEALDETGQEFGTMRLVQTFQEHAPAGASAIIRSLTDELKAFSGNFPQNDDITLIAIRKL